MRLQNQSFAVRGCVSVNLKLPLLRHVVLTQVNKNKFIPFAKFILLHKLFVKTKMTAQGMNKMLRGILQYRLKFKDQMLQQFQQVINQTF